MEKYSWRKSRLIQWIKPPDVTFNTNKKKLRQLIDDVSSKNGKILDLGSGGRRINDCAINFDLDIFDDVDVVGDARHLPFVDGKFELIIVTAVLEHIPSPEKVVLEMKRCLKNGGRIYAEVPFLQGFHADPNDFQRFTISGLRVLFDGLNEEESGVCVGPISVFTWYLRKFPTIFFSNIYLIKGIEFFTGWIVFLFKYLDFFLVKAKNAHVLASGLYFIGSKTQVHE